VLTSGTGLNKHVVDRLFKPFLLDGLWLSVGKGDNVAEDGKYDISLGLPPPIKSVLKKVENHEN